MNEYFADDPLEAAFHEVGHAVVSAESGTFPDTVSISSSVYGWQGKCVFPAQKGKNTITLGKGSPTLDHKSSNDAVMRGAAGALAQVKYLAEQEKGTESIFELRTNTSNLFQLIQKERIKLDNTQCSSSTIDIIFEGDEKCFVRQFEGAWLSGPDLGGIRLAVKNAEPYGDKVLSEALINLLKMLNDSRVWATIKRISILLCEQPLSQNYERLMDASTFLDSFNKTAD